MNINSSYQSHMYSSQMQMQRPSAEDMASNILKEVDTNSDGSISSDELSVLDSNKSNMLSKADTDGNGSITEDELLSKITEHIASKGQMGSSGGPQSMGGMPNVSDMINRILQDTDTDGDGSISSKELSSVGQKEQQKLSEADTDGNGIITEDELKSQINSDMSSNPKMPSVMSNMSDMTLNSFKDMLASLSSEDDSSTDASTQIQNYLSKLGLSKSDTNDLMNLLETKRFDVSA